MRTVLAWCVFAVAAWSLPAVAQTEPQSEFQKLPWVIGPAEGKIGDQATIKLSDELLFLGESGTSRLLELTGNPPRPGHYAVVPKEGDWFAIFSFKPEGYIADDEKLDADALLDALKQSDAPTNEERKRLGMTPLYTDGWQVAPHYDKATKRLEWGMRVRDEKGQMTINYSSRLLGRHGVMSAVLVTDPASLERDRQQFNAALTGFDFNAGNRYSEYVSGDKVAAYGLGALVLGGAAAAAAKAGGGKFIKAIGVAILAGAAGVWALIKRVLGRRRETVRME